MIFIIWTIGIVVWLILGLWTMRMWTGDMISMVSYNFPWLAIILLIGCITLWPIQHLYCWAIANTIGRYMDSRN